MHWIEIVLLIGVPGLAAVLVYRADQRRGLRRPWITAGLRALALILVGLLIFAPEIKKGTPWSRKPLVVWLQDRSQSMEAHLGADSNLYLSQMEAFRESLPKDYEWKQWGFGSQADENILHPFQEPATDIHEALKEIQRAYEGDNLGAVILASDGQFNQGANPLYHRLPLVAPVFTFGIGDTQQIADLELVAVHANNTVSLGNEIELRIQVRAQGLAGMETNLRIQEGDQEKRILPLTIRQDRWDAQPILYLRPDKVGWHHYRIMLDPVEGEEHLGNNTRDLFVEVVEKKKKILLAGAAPHPDIGAIRQALSTQDKWELEVAVGRDIPKSLEKYDLLILHQIPSQLPNLSRFRNLPPVPIWFILGELSGPGAFSEVQTLVRGNFHPGFGNQFLAELSGSFSLFELPNRSQEVSEALPPLYVPDGSFVMNPETAVLFRQKQKANALPLWTFGRHGQSQSLLLGTGLWRWRLHEYQKFGNHEVTDAWIQKTVEFLAYSHDSPPFQLVADKNKWNEGESIRLRATLKNASGDPVNTPEVELRLMDPNGQETPFSMERIGRNYQLSLGSWAAGVYRAVARTRYDGTSYEDEVMWTIEAQSLEQRTRGADYAVLHGLATQYGGKFVAYPNWDSLRHYLDAQGLLRTIVETRIEQKPLIEWKWAFIILLLLFSIEWYLRKYWMAD